MSRSAERRATLTGGVARRSLQLLWRGMAAHPGLYVLAVASSALYGGMTVAIGWGLGRATDAVVVPAITGSEQARAALAVAGVALAGVALMLALGVAGRRIFAGMGYAEIQADHRRGVTRQYLRLPMSWHRAHPTGQLLSNASADVEAATMVFNPLPFALGVVVMIAVAAVALLRVDLWLALTALTVIPLALLANLVFQRFMTPAATHAQQARAELADVAHESFEAALLVKALGTQDRERARFAARADRLRAANVQVGRVRAVFDPVIEFLPSLGTLAVLVVGVARMSAGAIGTGDIVFAAYLLTLMAVPVRAFGWVLGELPRALVGYQRIARVLDAAGEASPGQRVLPATGPAALELRGVRVVADDEELLHAVDLAVAPGQVVALVGSTGSGKSTLAGLPVRLREVADGTVLLDGVDVREVADLSDHVAHVAQQTFLFRDTVRGNVTLAESGEGPEDDLVWEALRTARLDRLVAGLDGGLDAPIGERGADLSGGQRQRLAIARALVRRPRLLVLDDATSAVDPRIEQQILTGLRASWGSTGPTVLLVAHRMSAIALADQVIHLEAGRVVDVGTHAELMRRDAGYRALATAYRREAVRRAEVDS